MPDRMKNKWNLNTFSNIDALEDIMLNEVSPSTERTTQQDLVYT